MTAKVNLVNTTEKLCFNEFVQKHFEVRECDSFKKQYYRPSGSSLLPEVRLGMKANPSRYKMGDAGIAACGDRHEEGT